MSEQELFRRIRIWLGLFILGVVLSGLTAFPLKREVSLLVRAADELHLAADSGPGWWLHRVYGALVETDAKYPFLAYGTDWLAFGHLAIAVAFWGPMRHPVRNRWVITFGLIACAGVIPLALIAGAVRGIPVYWRLIDCCFGVFGAIPLIICIRYVERLERLQA
jgi:hypothetical protein